MWTAAAFTFQTSANNIPRPARRGLLFALCIHWNGRHAQKVCGAFFLSLGRPGSRQSESYSLIVYSSNVIQDFRSFMNDHSYFVLMFFHNKPSIVRYRFHPLSLSRSAYCQREKVFCQLFESFDTIFRSSTLSAFTNPYTKKFIACFEPHRIYPLARQIV